MSCFIKYKAALNLVALRFPFMACGDVLSLSDAATVEQIRRAIISNKMIEDGIYFA